MLTLHNFLSLYGYNDDNSKKRAENALKTTVVFIFMIDRNLHVK